MSRARRPELDVPICVKINKWELFIGEKPIERPGFIMWPVRSRHDERWNLRGPLFKFFNFLVISAAYQERPGYIAGDAYSISRECRCRADSVPGYVSELIKRKFIQEVTQQDCIGLEGNEVEGMPPASSRKELPGASQDTWKKLFEAMPAATKRDLGITGWAFEQALELAATNRGTAYKGINLRGISLTGAEHLITDEIFENEIQGIYPGETRGLSDFTKSYCRLFIQQPRAVLFLIACIKGYKAHGGKWDAEKSPPGYAYEDFKRWLYSSWWDWFLDPRTKKKPEFLGYSGNNALLLSLQHNTSSSSGASENRQTAEHSPGETAPAAPLDPAANFSGIINQLKGKAP
jgi:hypothetical protein